MHTYYVRSSVKDVLLNHSSMEHSAEVRLNVPHSFDEPAQTFNFGRIL